MECQQLPISTCRVNQNAGASRKLIISWLSFELTLWSANATNSTLGYALAQNGRRRNKHKRAPSFLHPQGCSSTNLFNDAATQWIIVLEFALASHIVRIRNAEVIEILIFEQLWWPIIRFWHGLIKIYSILKYRSCVFNIWDIIQLPSV